MEIYIYDLEIYPNLFVAVFKNYKTQEYKVFEISIFKDERKELFDFISKNKLCLVGYNNYAFDDQLLYYMITNPNKKVSEYKIQANEIIKSQWNLVPDYKIYPKYITLCIDTMVINNYGIMGAKTTSLKMLSFNFRESSIEDLPIKHTANVNTLVNIKKVINYCKHDVDVTKKHFNITKPLIKYRQEFGKLYGFGSSLINTTEVRFSKKTLTDLFTKKMNMSIPDFNLLATYRSEIIVQDILISNKFPDKFKDIYNFELSENKELFNFYSSIHLKAGIKSKKYADKKIIDLEKVIAKVINYDNGLVTKVGSGGIHGVVPAGTYKSENGYVILDFDYGSYYPHLMYRFGFEPDHLPAGLLGKQLIETWFYERNSVYPKNTHYDLNYALKIIMNLCYGLLGSEYGPLFDQKAQLGICINGILLIIKMSEMCMLKGAEVLYQNTDGFMIRCKEEDESEMFKMLDDFAKLVNIPLEHEYVDTVWINDVNNYLLKTKKGKIKEKGCFVRYQTLCEQNDYHKDSSSAIIAEALHQYFVNNIPIETTVYNCNDIYDFCIVAKGGSSFDLLTSGIDNGIINENGELEPEFIFVEHKDMDSDGQFRYKFIQQEVDSSIVKNKVIDQRAIRYYCSNKGVTLSKLWYEESTKGLSFTSIEASSLVTICNKIGRNNIFDINKDGTISFKYDDDNRINYVNKFPNLDREFYLDKIREIINKIEIETI